MVKHRLGLVIDVYEFRITVKERGYVKEFLSRTLECQVYIVTFLRKTVGITYN